MMSENVSQLETDPRFPSGRWVGFWIQKLFAPGRFQTELLLSFAQGVLSGEGRDWVGAYTLHGTYNLEDGRCRWTKQYTEKHDVFYEGYNEGKGIWGTWKILRDGKGGFHTGPEGMPAPSGADLPAQPALP